jgi:tRNA pseudouridine55 synthase
VRRLAGQPRIGHGGTLDPFATGLLVLVLGRATRLAAFHQGGAKRYEATFSFGGATTTDDLDGEKILSSGPAATRERVEALLPHFRGALEQVPPSHSAKRTDGVRAYERARAGEIVELAPRAVEVTRFQITSWDESHPEEPLMGAVLDVSSGTYIRAIARDLGAALGCGAHLVALRRIGSGPFNVAQAHTMEAVAEAALGGSLTHLLLPLDAGIEAIPAITLGELGTDLLRDGAAIPDALLGEHLPVSAGEQVRLMAEGVLVALGRRTEAGVQPERVFITPNAAPPVKGA